MPKTYFIKTYGCQMNVADSAKLEDVLDSAGFAKYETDDDTSDIRELEGCDLVLVNTCVVRQHAEDRAAGFITSLSGLKEKNPNIILGVCGCYVTEPGRDLKRQFPHIDLFVEPNKPEKLSEFLALSTEWRGGTARRAVGEAFVTIAHGCDNYCSYCVVPYVRGREISRPMDEVLEEIKGLLEQGTTDITLLGQNVNSYKYGLATLLRKIELLVGSCKLVVRFMTSHPKDMSDAIILAVNELPYVAKEFHLPLQSGDNEILKKMNRGYTVEYYKDRIHKIRELIPNARITTDMLVGFPGETEAQFENSLKMIEKIRFAAVNMFAFSARPETAASKLPDQLPEEVKQARLHKLIETVRAVVKQH